LTWRKSKKSLNRPLELQEFEAPIISRQSTHTSGRFVSPKQRPTLTSRKYSWYSFLLEAESIPGPWCGRDSMKNPNSLMGKRTCDFPACSWRPQPNVPPATCPQGIRGLWKLGSRFRSPK